MGFMANRDILLMDVENRILEAWQAERPKGKGRAREAAWASHVRTCLATWYGEGVTFEEYCEWVDGGGGDEWVVEEG